MIVIGYQGIGKRTLAKLSDKYIDLESGCFWVDGKRSEDWYKPYCKIAEHLSQQGYVVFTSSHQVVRDELKNSSEVVMCCAPALELKSYWTVKLKERYEESLLEKDFKAWKNAEDRYEENIKEMVDSGFPMIWIKEIPYNLEALLVEAKFNKENKDGTAE